MKEENKYVTILKVLLFVSLVSLLISSVVNLAAFFTPYYGGVIIMQVFIYVGSQVSILVVFIVISLCLVIAYGLHLFYKNKVRSLLIMTFVFSVLLCVLSLAFFVLTIIMPFYVHSSLLSNFFTTMLAVYFSGFALSLLLALIYLGDFVAILREHRIKNIASK